MVWGIMRLMALMETLCADATSVPEASSRKQPQPSFLPSFRWIFGFLFFALLAKAVRASSSPTLQSTASLILGQKQSRRLLGAQGTEFQVNNSLTGKPLV